MTNSLKITALFYKGRLYQIGDIVKGEGEYLHTPYGFTKYPIGGVLTAIYVGIDSICNSAYLNHGFTYSSIGGLGYIFEIDGEKNYAFENTKFILPYLIKEKERFITNYYNHPINSDKLNNVLYFIKKEFNYNLSGKDIRNFGYFLRKNYQILFDYIWITFKIRQGDFGMLNDSNDLSRITMEVLKKECGYKGHTEDILWKFTANNQPEKKPLFKTF